MIDTNDVRQMVMQFGLAATVSGYDARFDLNGDNRVDIEDVIELAENYGKKQ